MSRSFTRLLIANRGEIAIRIARTAQRMGLTTIAVYSDADRDAPHVRACDLALPIGGAAPAESYLSINNLLAAAKASGAEAIHPGYGFLSERAEFAQAVVDAGLIFVGPGAAAMHALGDKAHAKQRMRAAGVSVLPGYDDADQQIEILIEHAQRIGFPVMIKACAGGGGRGMRLVHDAAQLLAALTSAASEALHAFGDARLLLERALLAPRHIEVQVFADIQGNAIHLFERDCSIQRRHQKIVEEAPAPGLSAAMREAMGAAAVKVAQEVGYVGVGTVEFLVQGDEFFFMEMNTRLQVEHPVTEAITGLDLVEWQLRVARGEPLPLQQDQVQMHGHAIEVRLCAEDPAADFLPQAGKIERWQAPDGIRVDHGLESGMTLSPWYDSMLGKLIAHGKTREDARLSLLRGVQQTVLFGLPSNRAFLAQVLAHPAFAAGGVSTSFIAEHFGSLASRSVPADDAVWAQAAWLSVQPDAAIPEQWRWFHSAGAVQLPVRLALDGVERSGVVTVERGGAVQVRLGDRKSSQDMAELIASHRSCNTLYLQTRAGEWRFEDRRLAARQSTDSAVGDGKIKAPMNGRVVALHQAPGAVVAMGDVLLTLEAMKMEHAVCANCAGTVVALHVAVGDQVTPGKLLAQIAPAKGATHAHP